MANLLAWFKFNSSLADGCGNATLNTIGSPGYNAGRFTGSIRTQEANALNFNPTFRIPRVTTLAFWTKTPLSGNNASWHTLVRGSSSDGGHHVIVGHVLTELGVYSNKNGGFFSSGFFLNTLANGWHHFVVKIINLDSSNDTGYTMFYVDGKYVGTANRACYDPAGLYGMGCYNDGSQSWGDLADFRFYDGLLTDEEIQELARPPIKGLKAWYKFEDNLVDSSDSNNTATVAGGSATYVNGKIGKAASFDGSNTAFASAFKPQADHDFTFSVWIYYLYHPSTHSIRAITGTADNPGILGTVYFGVSDNDTNVNFYASFCKTGQGEENPTFALGDIKNKWVRVTVTYQASTKTVKVYKGKTLIDTKQIVRGFDFGSTFRIGQSWGWYPWYGYIDDMRWYDYILSKKEINDLVESKILHYKFNGMSQVQPPTDKLIAWLDADDLGADGSSIDTWWDKSGNWNHFTQTTAGKRPTVLANALNGHKAVHEVAASQQYLENNTNFAAPVSIFYVGRLGTTKARMLSGRNNNWLAGFWNGYKRQAYYNGWVGANSDVAADTNPYVWSTIIAGGTTNSQLYENGVLVKDSNGGVTGPNGLVTSGYMTTLTEMSDGDIFEILIYNEAVTYEKRKTIEAYLINKYFTNLISGKRTHILDSSDYGLDGLAIGCDPVTNSKFGSKALDFNGSSHYAVAPVSNEFALGDFTVSFWVYFKAGFSNAWARLVETTHNNGFAITRNNATNNLWFSCYNVTPVISSTEITVGQWVHYAFVREGTACRIFKNGIADGSGLTSAGIINAENLNISTYIQTLGYGSPIILDDLQIHATALTQAEIQEKIAEPKVRIDRNANLFAEEVTNTSVKEGLLLSEFNQDGRGGNLIPKVHAVSYWSMDDDPTLSQVRDQTDLYAQTDAGFVNTPTRSTDRFGKPGSIIFNGSNQYLDISNHAKFDLQKFTIRAWVKSANFAHNGHVFEKGSVNTQYSLFFDASNNGTIYFRTINSSGTLHDLTVTCSTAQCTNNAWHLVACTYDGAYKRIFVDGVKRAEIAYTQTLKTGQSGQRIGAFGGSSPGYYFNGQIDELAIYDTPYSEAQMGLMYQSELLHRLNYPFIVFDGRYCVDCVCTGSSFPNWQSSGNYLIEDSTMISKLLSNNKPFTFSVWLNIPTYVAQDNFGGIYGGNYRGFKAGFVPDTGQLRVTVGRGQMTGSWANLDVDAPVGSEIPLNTWGLFTMTYDGATVKSYWNTTLVASSACASVDNGSSIGLKMGVNSWDFFGRFVGKLSSLRIYSRAITPAEIERLCNERYVTKKGQLVIPYKAEGSAVKIGRKTVTARRII